MEPEKEMGDEVIILTSGLVACSVCAPASMPIEEVERQVNLENPTGISSGWTLSEDKTFASGEPNPCTCQNDPKRLHYLFAC